jgi:outer membrane protein TolC
VLERRQARNPANVTVGTAVYRKMASLQSRPLLHTRGPQVPLAVIVAALVALAPQPAAARRYTLPELVAKVNAAYSGVQAARENVEAADAQMSQANRLWWPTGQLTFALTGSPEVRCFRTLYNSMNQPIGETPDTHDCTHTNVVDLRSGEQVLPVHGVAFNLGINVVQPLYTFGKIESAKRLAKAGIEVARAQVDKDRADVTFNITRAYWLLKSSRAASAVLDDVRGRLKDWVKHINDEIDKGKTTYTENDLVRIKLALDTAELTALDVEKGKQLGLAGLRMLLDEADADIDDEELDFAEVTEQPLSFYEDAAVVHRPEARMLAAGMVAARANRQLQLANLMPDVGVAASFTYSFAQSVDNPDNAFMNHPNALGAGLALAIRYNLDVPMRLANHSKAAADERMAQQRRKQALGGISIEIENAWLEAHAARRRSELLNHSEKVARGWYNAVDQNLQVGVAESRDLVDAARSFFELRMRHLQSIMDANLATASLKQAAGVLVQ